MGERTMKYVIVMEKRNLSHIKLHTLGLRVYRSRSLELAATHKKDLHICYKMQRFVSQKVTFLPSKASRMTLRLKTEIPTEVIRPPL